MTAVRRMYLNDKQLAFARATAKTRVWVGGRGSGKSHEIGVVNRQKPAVMPRSRGFICSTTYEQLASKTWPGIEASWEIFGLKEGIHYFYGVQPPKAWAKPISRVRRYGNVVSFRNGSIIEFLSMDRPDTARGGSFDHGDIDEAALLKKEHWTKVLLPAIRGNRHRFGGTHWHQMVGMYTSMPWKATGLWILDYEEKAQLQPDKYFYQTATAMDNLHIIGEEGIERMREEMTYLEFQMEVMNQKIVQTEDAFYVGLNEATHCYQPQYQYGEDVRGRDITIGTKDINPDAMLETSWDFGGWFNCCAVFQEHSKREERMVSAFNGKGNEKIGDVVRKFCDHHRQHRHKFVRLWGEPRGHDREAKMTDSNYDFAVKKFRDRGWRTQVMAPRKQSRRQSVRQVYMSTILAEDTRGYPTLRLNQDTCKWVFLALQSAEKNPDGSKNKKMEKDRSFPQEQATHITDAVDYYFDQKWGPRLSSSTGNTLLLPGAADFL